MTPGKVTSSDNASNTDLSLSVEVPQKDETLSSDTKDIKKAIVSFDSDISNPLERSENKNNETTQKAKVIDDKTKSEVMKFYNIRA